MADTTELLDDAGIDPVTGEIIDQKVLAKRLLAQAKEEGVSLVGSGGLLCGRGPGDRSRGVTAAHETVAARLGMSAKTVQRARQLMEVLGVAMTVAEGRYLTTAERQEADRRHGGHQLRAASTRALTMPAGYRPRPSPEVAAGDRESVENVQLPSPSGVKGSDARVPGPNQTAVLAAAAV